MLPKLETISPAWTDYELLDTGSGRKLERFGSVTLVRPEPQADWPPALPEKSWNAAHANFIQLPRSKSGEWKFAQSVPSRWPMTRKNLSFWVEPTPSGHLGVFPDQASHWDWLASLIEAAAPPKVLSLFGYTGLATLACARAGAKVTHVDASRRAIKWARENQSLSELSDCPIRWLADDASSFVARELWKAEESLPALLGQCRKLLSAAPLFVLLNTYTTVLTRGQTAREGAELLSFLKEMLVDHSSELSVVALFLAEH